jgi:hypothetical protein
VAVTGRKKSRRPFVVSVPRAVDDTLITMPSTNGRTAAGLSTCPAAGDGAASYPTVHRPAGAAFPPLIAADSEESLIFCQP